MRIAEPLRVYWRETDTVQLGIDPRVALIVEGLSRAEQDLLEYLCTERTAVEIEARAAETGISPARLKAILAMLRAGGVLAPESVHGLLAQSVEPRARWAVSVPRLDLLGTEIALGLVRAGVQVFTDDESPVSAGDHPLLRKHGVGLSRQSAFRGIAELVREPTPVVARPERARDEACGGAGGEARGGEATGAAGAAWENGRAGWAGGSTSASSLHRPRIGLAVVTGRAPIDPERCAELMADGVPHLLAYAEEVDVCVGPLVEPGRSACARCVDCTRQAEDPAWIRIAPQLWQRPGFRPNPLALEMAAALAVRTAVSFLAGRGNALRDGQWRVPPAPVDPRRIDIAPHTACGCTEPELRLAQLEREIAPLADDPL